MIHPTIRVLYRTRIRSAREDESFVQRVTLSCLTRIELESKLVYSVPCVESHVGSRFAQSVTLCVLVSLVSLLVWFIMDWLRRNMDLRLSLLGSGRYCSL